MVHILGWNMQYASSKKIVSFQEQINSKDIYLSTLSLQTECTVFIIVQIFLATPQFSKLGNITQILLSFSLCQLRGCPCKNRPLDFCPKIEFL